MYLFRTRLSFVCRQGSYILLNQNPDLYCHCTSETMKQCLIQFTQKKQTKKKLANLLMRLSNYELKLPVKSVKK